MTKEIINIGVIGLGIRGRFLMNTLLEIDNANIFALCDPIGERLEQAATDVVSKTGKKPLIFADFNELLSVKEIDAVLVCTTWITHCKIAIAAMKAGKHVGMEVGGAASIEECWQLVRVTEETGKKFMLLENCCYADNELALFNMERKGLFGELIHLQGGYEHDLREEIVLGKENKHGRLYNFLNRNGDLYPTHQLGPIAKMLRINRGNRFLMLTSMASKSRGLHEWILENKGKDYYLANKTFEQGDIVTTMIKCAHGETVLLLHGVSLPRPYSRDGRIQGTKGIWLEDGNTIYLHGISPYNIQTCHEDPHQWENFDNYRKTYRHPLWLEYEKKGIKEGHGGIDYLVLSAFADCIIKDIEPPIDVYDTAVWMSITCLSEQSVAMGSMPVPVPDFTSGSWINRPELKPSKYSLDEVHEDLFI
ncbi:MAG: Gfo/Idh/MocA family oxidoreductase [Clostridia bacterium]|nr:Gfo/Idh/MocA family oxidoreductase [Clostridia bacterium]